jgi:hypothetical protein
MESNRITIDERSRMVHRISAHSVRSARHCLWHSRCPARYVPHPSKSASSPFSGICMITVTGMAAGLGCDLLLQLPNSGEFWTAKMPQYSLSGKSA